MSAQQTAKRERRQARKVVGIAGLQSISTQMAALERVANTQQAQQASIQGIADNQQMPADGLIGLATRLDAEALAHVRIMTDQNQQIERLEADRRDTFYGRLKLLVLGR